MLGLRSRSFVENSIIKIKSADGAIVQVNCHTTRLGGFMAAKQGVLAELHEALAQLMLNELRWYMSWLPIKLRGLYDHH